MTNLFQVITTVWAIFDRLMVMAPLPWLGAGFTSWVSPELEWVMASAALYGAITRPHCSPQNHLSVTLCSPFARICPKDGIFWWLMPLSSAVHLNLGRVPVDEVGLAAQSRQGFSVDLFKLEFKWAFVFVSNLLRMANCKVFCKCILAICYGCLHEFWTIMESYTCFTVQNMCDFSVQTPAVFYMEGPRTEKFSHLNCLFVLVLLFFVSVVCLLWCMEG